MKMVNRQILVLLWGIFLLSPGGCVKTEKSSEVCSEVQKSDWTKIANHWADSVIKSMSLEEMVGQLFMPASYASADYYTIRRLKRYVTDNHVGGVVFLQGDTLSQRILSDTLQSISRVPMFMAIDAEWGLGMRLKDAPIYPMNGLLGKADDQQMYGYGYEVARQSRLLGINMILGPVLDVLDKSGRGAIGNRSFGDDPHRVASLAIAYARGVEDGNVLSVGKHFPGHGSAEGDSHDILPVVDKDKALLDSIDLYPFKAYSSAGLSAIMVGHLYVPAIDEVERSSIISPVVTTEYLKEHVGFNGLVLTDAINMKGAKGSKRLGLEALMAGADIILTPEDTSHEIEIVITAILNGEISPEIIKEKCRRVLFYKYRFVIKTE